ncbi:MAG: hypothetical protein H0X64_03565 [Gemmatimonadaceae bacterium]|nr:hypothetical protein [Gemmatimonadaceae bacterium]
MRPLTLPKLFVLAAPMLIAACTDDRPNPVAPAAPVAPVLQSEGRGAFQRYVAIGTSVSMGWRSDGVVASAQATSWPVLLAELAHRTMTVPAIAEPGCGAPIAAPIAGGVRTSGEGIGQAFDTRACAPSVAGVSLPANNVAITAATTRNALYSTPGNITGEYLRLYSRVLAPGQSQVTAMMGQEPKVVTIELGANEVLGARSGVFLPGVNVVPVAAWEADYLKVLDSAQKVAKHVALVGLIDHAESFPSFRTGHEIWQGRAAFAQLWVEVSPDCENSPNLLFVAARVPAAAAQGGYNARTGAGRAPFSCVNYPSATGIQDYVLGPDDVAALDAQLAQMDAIILREAQRRGFAHFRLAALYEDVNVKAPFDPIALLMQQQPYGRYVSLDGFHPTADGARVIANAAARAFDARYGFGITGSGALFAAGH